MIFVTGDTHRLMDIKKLNEDNFQEQSFLTRNDYLIIAGDFGAVWTGTLKDDEALDYYANKNFTTLFVGGNHENYDALEKYPIEKWNGGNIRRIRDNIFYLMNGQVFEIDGYRFFVMGGATSVDKIFRTEGESWWAQEEPEQDEYEEAFRNLASVGNNVDFIITHTIPEKVRRVVYETYSDFVNYESPVERFLDLIMENIHFTKWFAGHLHIDRDFPEYRLRILYNGVVKIA